ISTLYGPTWAAVGAATGVCNGPERAVDAVTGPAGEAFDNVVTAPGVDPVTAAGPAVGGATSLPTTDGAEVVERFAITGGKGRDTEGATEGTAGCGEEAIDGVAVLSAPAVCATDAEKDGTGLAGIGRTIATLVFC